MNAPNEEIIFTLRLWVQKAEHDLRNAEYTLTLLEDCPFDTICYHAQQCVEKYLKALLIWNTQDFPKVHDLRLLLQKASLVTHISFEIEKVLSLNRYAAEARYPVTWEPISQSEAEEAVAIAKTVREEIRKRLPAKALS